MHVMPASGCFVLTQARQHCSRRSGHGSSRPALLSWTDDGVKRREHIHGDGRGAGRVLSALGPGS